MSIYNRNYSSPYSYFNSSSGDDFDEYSVSVCGPVSYDVANRQALMIDLIKAMK